MKKVIDFINESAREMRENVTWTKYSELQTTATVVLVASMIFALVIGAMDWVFKVGLETLYKSFQ